MQKSRPQVSINAVRKMNKVAEIAMCFTGDFLSPNEKIYTRLGRIWKLILSQVRPQHSEFHELFGFDVVGATTEGLLAVPWQDSSNLKHLEKFAPLRVAVMAQARLLQGPLQEVR